MEAILTIGAVATMAVVMVVVPAVRGFRRRARRSKAADAVEGRMRADIATYARSHSQPARSADVYEPYHRELLRGVPEERWRQ